ncbi:MAG: hypothetical protein IKH18_02445 [Clostridia bacterium]|nr:hypothetical protein [Clostridia bacterium]
MAYTALERMRERNLARFGRDLGPEQPALHAAVNANDLKGAALRFLHDGCEGLLFDPAVTAEEERTGVLQGTSLKPGQIPRDMQADIDRLCLERELERFIDSGTAEDAYNIYYCFLEMFMGRYGRGGKAAELLSEYETNGSSLLLKHRDHYSHSVYVFTLGLAVYQTNAAYRECFARDLGLEPGSREAACDFLEYWGLTSLFHDIGYPFELPFEQVMSYFEVSRQDRGKECPYPAYRNLEPLTRMTPEAARRFESLLGGSISGADELTARRVTQRLGKAYGFTEEYLLDVIRRKPAEPERFSYFMDHAYFSAMRLYRELEGAYLPEELTAAHADVLGAILLHNSLFKFSVCFYKDPEKRRPPLKMEQYPLAWLLMLCDELQCWDRTAYGRNSRTELHPMGAEFRFGPDRLDAVYYYDREELDKIRGWEADYAAWESAGGEGRPPRLKDYSDMAEKGQRFTADIERIVDTSGLRLAVRADTRVADYVSKHTYLSRSSFLHMYDFAVALNARYNFQGREDEVRPEELERDFDALSLEYKLLNINQVKSFGRYLNAIDCFYTDRPVAFEMLHAFTQEEIDTFAPMEHGRWVLDHARMGWREGSEYETLPVTPAEGQSEKAARSALREQLRRHKQMKDGERSPEALRQHYLSLPKDVQGRDWMPFNSMLRLIRKFDGLRIYRLK